MYDENWESIYVNDSLGKFYDVIRIRDEFYIIDVSVKIIEVFVLVDFQKFRSIDMYYLIYGIMNLNDILYIVCGDKILKVDNRGLVLQIYNFDGKNMDYIIIINSGLIVYSNWYLDIVIVMCDEG